MFVVRLATSVLEEKNLPLYKTREDTLYRTTERATLLRFHVAYPTLCSDVVAEQIRIMHIFNLLYRTEDMI